MLDYLIIGWFISWHRGLHKYIPRSKYPWGKITICTFWMHHQLAAWFLLLFFFLLLRKRSAAFRALYLNEASLFWIFRRSAFVMRISSFVRSLVLISLFLFLSPSLAAFLSFILGNGAIWTNFVFGFLTIGFGCGAKIIDRGAIWT